MNNTTAASQENQIPRVAFPEQSLPDLGGLKWRNIGPMFGGRGTSAMGHPTDSNVFFFGHSSGGFWRTDDAGETWTEVGAGQFRYGSIGAFDLYEKNPDIMYVGTGESQLRNSVSWGDGVYKTTDGGKTWTHLGLTEARHISKVHIHPDDPNVVWVGSMGHAFGPSPDRGVFKTTDGGKTWNKVLYKNDGAGVIDIAINPSNPDELFAAVWEFDRKAWFAKTGGPDSGLWHSTDGGENWTEITRNPGLPKGQYGRIGIAMSAADSKRVYVLVDNETKAGVYRSDNNGKTWRFVSDYTNLTSRPFYYTNILVDPQNADKVWVPVNKIWHSNDAGETWIHEPSSHDDYHSLWIDPKNPKRMIGTSDGGAMVTLSGGHTWSRFDTQSGAQFYRVATDDQFPYRVYANAQDNLTCSVPNATKWGGIPSHYTDYISAGETGAAIPKPGDPNIVYSLSTGATYGASTHLTRTNLKTGQSELRSVWPETLFGTTASEFKYRFNWNAPFVISPHDPNTLYMAGNVVFRSRDEGITWDKISDDLTHNMTEKLNKLGGTPWMPEYFGQEIFSTILRMEESPHEKGVIWTGSDDGRIHITRNDGDDWKEVTPTNLPELSAVYEIEVSPHDKATAYVAITRYRKADDYKPYLLKTTDYGATWTRLDAGFPQDEITRTIREDTERKGLLFVGTETGIYVSIDDGLNWKPMSLNMPPVPVHDIEVKGADLVIATHGRGFWVLDDIGPLRQVTPEMADMPSYLFKPEDHTRFGFSFYHRYGGGKPDDQMYHFLRVSEPGFRYYERGIVNGERKREWVGAGEGEPHGVLFYYLLSDQAKEVQLEVLDADGKVIRTYTEKELPTERFTSVTHTGYQYDKTSSQPNVSVGKGLNRFMWDMRYPLPEQVPGRVPVSIDPIAKPGTYKVRLTVDGKSQEQEFELKINPNETYTRAQTDAKFETWMELWNTADIALKSVNKALGMKKQTAEAAEKDPSLKSAAENVAKIADAYEASMVPTGVTLVQLISEPTGPLALLQTLHYLQEESEGPTNQPWHEVYDKIKKVIAEKESGVERDLAESMKPFTNQNE